MNFDIKISKYFDNLKKTIDNLDKQELNKFIELLLNAYHNDAVIFICGNGGSASTSSHFVCDINKGASYGLEKRFKVISLNDNIPILMAYANDVSYEDIFLEQIKNYIQPNDLVIGISGSGNSFNIIKVIEYANNNGNTTFGITGYSGGKLKQISKFSLNSNIDDMQITEDIHMIIVHLTMQILKEEVLRCSKIKKISN